MNASSIERQRDSLKESIAKLKALRPCPVPNATTPPPTPPQTIPAPPPCYDDAARADLIKSENDFTDLNAQIDKTNASINEDKKNLDFFSGSRGENSSEANAFRLVLQEDQTKLNGLLDKVKALKAHIDDLNHLKSCPAPNGTPPARKTSNDSGALDDILGHTTIGIGIGGGGSHNRNRNSGHSDQQASPNSQPNDKPNNQPNTTPQSDSPSSPH